MGKAKTSEDLTNEVQGHIEAMMWALRANSITLSIGKLDDGTVKVILSDRVGIYLGTSLYEVYNKAFNGLEDVNS